ncbi:MAG: glutathione synthase [bacterium]|jgi:glutathione synthase
MSLKIGIIMDPLETIHIDKDTTFALAFEAQQRGYSIWFILMENLTIKDEEPFCIAQQIEFKRENPCYQFVNDQEELSLDDFDVVLMRKDPPFDSEFFFATHFLSLCKKAKVLNRPDSLRNAPEKLYSLNFPGIFPPTVITRRADEIRKFMNEQGGEIILKPLDGCGGKGIIYLHDKDQNFNSLVEISTNEGTTYIMAQKYLPEVRQGDKRIICVNGTARGAVLRIPSSEEHRANLHVGGRAEFHPLTEREQWLVDQVTPKLQEDGLYFVGLDVIGDYITEINVTSPTGIQEIKDLGGVDIAKIFWDELSLD